MSDLSKVRLGRKSVTHDPKRRAMATTLLESLPPAPLACDNTMGVSEWGMDGNDAFGDCVFAGLDHHQQVVTLDAGQRTEAGTAAVLAAYTEYTGFNRNHPSTDLGANELDILTRVMAAEQGIFGHKLLGLISPDPKNLDHVKKAIAYFRAVYMGCEMPINFRGQQVWTAVENDGGIEGGHCMVNASYTADLIPFITWGANQPAEWGWWLKYVDEVHILVWDTTLQLFPAATKGTILNMLEELN